MEEWDVEVLGPSPEQRTDAADLARKRMKEEPRVGGPGDPDWERDYRRDEVEPAERDWQEEEERRGDLQ